MATALATGTVGAAVAWKVRQLSYEKNGPWLFKIDKPSQRDFIQLGIYRVVGYRENNYHLKGIFDWLYYIVGLNWGETKPITMDNKPYPSHDPPRG